MRLEVGIIKLVEESIGVRAERRAQFEWLRNKPRREDFGKHYDAVIALYTALGGELGRHNSESRWLSHSRCVFFASLSFYF